jgi:hypothetical protein
MRAPIITTKLYRARMTPSSVESFDQSFTKVARAPRPCANSIGHAVCSDPAGSPCIISLFRAASPSYIPWFVVTIVVDAVKRVIRRGTAPHLGDKRLERLKPKFNTSASVERIFREVDQPTTVFGGSEFSFPVTGFVIRPHTQRHHHVCRFRCLPAYPSTVSRVNCRPVRF